MSNQLTIRQEERKSRDKGRQRGRRVAAYIHFSIGMYMNVPECFLIYSFKKGHIFSTKRVIISCSCPNVKNGAHTTHEVRGMNKSEQRHKGRQTNLDTGV